MQRRKSTRYNWRYYSPGRRDLVGLCCRGGCYGSNSILRLRLPETILIVASELLCSFALLHRDADMSIVSTIEGNHERPGKPLMTGSNSRSLLTIWGISIHAFHLAKHAECMLNLPEQLCFSYYSLELRTICVLREHSHLLWSYFLPSVLAILSASLEDRLDCTVKLFHPWYLLALNAIIFAV